MRTTDRDRRLPALRRFAVAITVLNLLGHTVLGFEQSWAQPLVALAAAYGCELLLQLAQARLSGRPAPWAGGLAPLADCLLAPHITGLAVSMLTYASDRLMPIAYASAAAIASKFLLRIPLGRGSRHFFNPSNFGISLVLLLFPWVGIAQPYQFTENLGTAGDIALPLLIIASGSFLNARFTRRIPLIATWLAAFVAQAAARSLVFGTPLSAALVPMTGVAFILFTFYMLTDPATTPDAPRGQALFGAAVAAAYGLLVSLHVVFGLFFALSIVCGARGLALYAAALRTRRAERALTADQALPALVSR